LIPLWLKIAWTVFVLILIPVYWRHNGPANFLWFSDIALLALTVALWTENRIIASTMAVSVLFPEIVWNIAYFGRLLTGYKFAGLAAYMWDASSPVYLRGLSLFHVFLPVALVWLLWRLGYDPLGLRIATLVVWIVLPITYLASTQTANVNWVFGINEPQQWMHPWAWVAVLMIVIPLLVHLPTHFILRAFFSK